VPRTLRLIIGVLCCLGVLAVLGMFRVHADWGTGKRVTHVGIVVALAVIALLCLRPRVARS
jgi:hypothetical protein